MTDKKTMMPLLAATTELVTVALLEKISSSQIQEFMSCPQDFIKSKLFVKTPTDVQINFAHNSELQVALMLPYYNSLSSISEKLEESGVSVSTAIGSVLGSTITVASVSTGGLWSVSSSAGIGAAIGAAVGTGMVAAIAVGVAGAKSKLHGQK